MLTLKHRPKNLKELYGQPIAKSILRSIFKDPENSVRSLMLIGAYGAGKTSCARLLAYGLNCDNRDSNGPCGHCPNCLTPLETSPFYVELDSALAGSAEKVRSLREEIYVDTNIAKYRIIVWDEAQLMSRAAQSALLKEIEESPPNIFTVFASTDPDRLLSTIRSRSAEIVFNPLSEEDIIANLKSIANIEGIKISDKTLKSIAVTSRGHVRNSVMALDLYRSMESEEEFLATLQTKEEDILRLILLSVTKAPLADLRKKVESIVSIPLEVVRSDFYMVMRNLIEVHLGIEVETPYLKAYQTIVQQRPRSLDKILSEFCSSWVGGAFQNNYLAEGVLWHLVKFFKDDQTAPGSQSSHLAGMFARAP